MRWRCLTIAVTVIPHGARFLGVIAGYTVSRSTELRMDLEGKGPPTT